MVRVAILGTGFVANVFAKDAGRVDGLELAAVLGICEQDAVEFGERHGIGRRYTSYDELLRDPSIDMVYVALPNHLHYPFAKRALEAGKHAVVEKPFVATEEEVESLVACAREHGAMVFDAITTKYVPLLETLREQLGRAGAVRAVTSSYCQYSSRYDAVRAGEVPGVFSLESDGGALKDLGIYPVTFVVSLFGRPQGAHYFANKLPNGCDTSGTLVLTYPTFVATIRVAKDSFTENRCTVEGEDGTFFVDDDCFRFPNLRFRANARAGSEDLGSFEPYGGIANEFRHFVDIVERGDAEKSWRLASRAADAVATLAMAAESAGIVYGKER